jgi:hypothetical protein
MTAATKIDYVPTMDEARRFIRSNPSTSWETLVDVLGLGNEDKATVSGGRFRELWKLAGGMVDSKGNAWVEIETLPSVLRKIIDAVGRVKPNSAEYAEKSWPKNQWPQRLGK